MSHSATLSLKDCYPAGMFSDLLSESLGELFYTTMANSELKSIMQDEDLTDLEKKIELKKKKQEIASSAGKYLNMVQATGNKVKYMKNSAGILVNEKGEPFEKNGKIDVYDYQGRQEPQSVKFWNENKDKVESITIIKGSRGKSITSDETYLCNDLMIAETPDENMPGYFKPTLSFDSYNATWSDLPSAEKNPEMKLENSQSTEERNERSIKMINKVIQAKFKEITLKGKLDTIKKSGAKIQIKKSDRDLDTLDVDITVDYTLHDQEAPPLIKNKTKETTSPQKEMEIN